VFAGVCSWRAVAECLCALLYGSLGLLRVSGVWSCVFVPLGLLCYCVGGGVRFVLWSTSWSFSVAGCAGSSGVVALFSWIVV